jgi:serine/threonine-protein kinase
MSLSDTPLHRSQDRSVPDAVSSHRDLTGQTIADYRIERLLGRGGMGEVYLARQLSLDRPVALKVLKPELVSNPTYLARFEKEALGAARLSHPNIVHIYSFGGAGDLKCIAMEYVQGINLKDYLVRKGTPELALALSIMRQAGQAVAAAGEAGLVHRDIKPENLLLTRKGQVKVADFGLCRELTQAADLGITQEGITVGTPMYMSPEQVQGRDLDHRSDLYSLGVTYYHMLAGQPPFRGETALAVAVQHVQGTAVDLAVHRPDLPRELCALVMKLMAKDPKVRYASAGEMLRDLARVRESVSGSAAMAVSLPSVPVLTATPVPAARPARRGAERRRDAAADPSAWRLRARHVLVALGLSALVGGVLGSRGRAENLLSPQMRRPEGPPALWLDAWDRVSRLESVRAQYRHAQLGAVGTDRAAAWLAVPGHFPSAARDEGWAAKAYIQLARELFRRGDPERLEALGRALEASPGYADPALTHVAPAAAAVLHNDLEGMLRHYEHVAVDQPQNPALAELSLEIVVQARRNVDRMSSLATRLRALEEKLNEDLAIPPLLRLAWTGPGQRSIAASHVP